MTRDMTTGSPIRLILTFSIPLLIGNVFQQFYSMADTIIVGRTIGTDALAAVGATGGMSFLILGFITGVTGGFAVITAQRFGANDPDGVRHSVAVSTWLCLIITAVLTVLSMFAAMPMLQLMHTPDNIIQDAYAYIIIIYAGTGASIFYNMISSILRALGDSKTPLYFLIIACVLNIILDFVCILNFKMGVAGAGVATVIAQLVAALLCVIYTAKKFPILRMKKSDWKLDGFSALLHLRVGLPMALQFAITATGVMVLQSALNGFGSATIAAYTAGSKVQQLAMQPMNTFGITMATYAAQNLGAGRIDRIREGVRKCTLVSFLFCLGGGLLMIFCGDLFVRLFITNPSEEVLQNARIYLLISAVFFIVLSLLFIYRNTLQGMGLAFMPTMAGVIEFIMRTGAAFGLAAPLGYVGVCLADPIAWLGATIPLIVTYCIVIRRMEKRYALGPTLAKR